jgi:hypothetical protein
MGKSKRQARQFLQKEIKTYTALALFLSKKGEEDRLQLGRREGLKGPVFYRDRMKEARKLIHDLGNTK